MLGENPEKEIERGLVDDANAVFLSNTVVVVANTNLG